ncbi:MAG: hypothetical protein M3022_13435 [Actinomycetota bacterium]|nr:hypothetical protein [Actinomycetota bacterium]
MILEGWRDAVRSGQYTAVRYDCASPSVAHWIARLARKIGLTDREFVAYEQTTAEHIAAMPTALPGDEPATKPAEPSDEREPTPEQQAETAAPVQVPAPREPEQIRPPKPPPPQPETPRQPPSAGGATAKSSASTNPNRAADGAANADLLDAAQDTAVPHQAVHDFDSQRRQRTTSSRPGGPGARAIKTAG